MTVAPARNPNPERAAMNNPRLTCIRKSASRFIAALLAVAILGSPSTLHSMKTPVLTAPASNETRMRVTAMVVRMAVNPLARHPQDRRFETRTVALSPAFPAVSPRLSGGRTRRIASVKIPAEMAPPSPAAMAHAQASLELLKNMPGAAPALRDAAARPDKSAVPPRSILALGDSLSIGLADALEAHFAQTPGLRFAKCGKVSSGLARPDFFDWGKRAEELAMAHKPDVAVIMIAANDNKTMTTPAGARVAFGRPGWNEEYARRVQDMIDILRRHNPDAKIFWAGAPVMADAGLDKDIRTIHGVIKAQLAKNPEAWFVDTRGALAGADGRYAQYLPSASGKARKIRAADGVHLTAAGASLLAETCLDAMSRRIVLAVREKPAPLMLSENAVR